MHLSAIRDKRVPHLALFASFLAVSLSGCGDGGAPHQSRGPDVDVPAQLPWIRPADNLIQRPELRALVDAQTRRDAAPLIQALEDPDASVRARAALGLASVAAPEAVPGLLEAVRDPDVNVRRDAAFALGRTGGYGVPEALMDFLALERSPIVAETIVHALGSVGGPEQLAGLMRRAGAGPFTEWGLAIAIARFGMRDVHDGAAQQWLTDRLRSPDPGLRVASAYYFSRVPLEAWTRSLPQVREALASYQASDPAAMFLALALGKGLLPEDEPQVVQVLRVATDWRSRANAALGLRRPSPLPETRAALFDALQDPSPRVVIAAASALAAVQQPPPGDVDAMRAFVEASEPDEWQPAAAFLPVLARLAEDEAILDWMARQPVAGSAARAAGAEALGLSPSPGVTEDLLALLDDPAPEVAGAAMRGLARRWAVLSRTGTDPSVGFDWMLRGMARPDFLVAFPAASNLSDPAFAPLGAADSILVTLDRFRQGGASTRVQAALMVALGRMGDERIRPLADSLLSSADVGLAQGASRALEGLGDPPVSFPADAPWRPGVDWEQLSRLGRHPVLTLLTERGEVRLQLDAELAPLTVAAITALAEAGRYDGVPFHRVEPNFVVQGGDVEGGVGYGGPGFNLRTESTPEPFWRGTLGMASAGKDTEGSQFFINHVMSPHLDGSYTVFGWTQEGIEVVDALRRFDPIIRATVEADNTGG